MLLSKTKDDETESSPRERADAHREDRSTWTRSRAQGPFKTKRLEKVNRQDQVPDPPMSRMKQFLRRNVAFRRPSSPDSARTKAGKEYPPLRDSFPKKCSRFFTRKRRKTAKTGTEYDEISSGSESDFSLHSVPSVVSDERVSVESSVTCGYPVHAPPGGRRRRGRWVDVGLNADYIKEQQRNASAVAVDPVEEKPGRLRPSTSRPAKNGGLVGEPVYTRDALRRRAQTSHKSRIPLPPLRRDTDSKRKRIHANCRVVGCPARKKTSG